MAAKNHILFVEPESEAEKRIIELLSKTINGTYDFSIREEGVCNEYSFDEIAYNEIKEYLLNEES